MAELRSIEQDVLTLLKCPNCGHVELRIESNTLVCPSCETSYPGDDDHKMVTIIPPNESDVHKKDIQQWWADLYKQAYSDHEHISQPKDLLDALEDLEDLFKRREHLATTEMGSMDIRGKKLLEIGCGAGGHSALFARNGAEVTSVDITLDRAQSAANKLSLISSGTGRAYHADAENLPFRDDVFDVVYSNGVLHHSSDTSRCIEEVFRVLKPGGHAVLMLYSRYSAIFLFNILPRAILSGKIFRLPEARWIGELTEGTPKFGETRNPFTRVYSANQITTLLAKFNMVSLRKCSFQFDNFCVPKLTQLRHKLLSWLGYQQHPGGKLVYGFPHFPETKLELNLGKYAGFAWNIVARKPADTLDENET